MADVTYRIAVSEDGSIRNIRRQDMAQAKFIWTAAETYARSKGGKSGAHLETGKTYDTADFDPAVVAEWVSAGAAEWTDKARAKKEAQ